MNHNSADQTCPPTRHEQRHSDPLEALEQETPAAPEAAGDSGKLDTVGGPALDDTARLVSRYVHDGASLATLAVEYQTSKQVVSRRLRAAGVTTRAPGGVAVYPQLQDPAYLVERLVTNSGTVAGLARELGCSDTTVRKATKRPANAAALEAAGWNQEANAAATRVGRPAVVHMPDDEAVISAIATLREATVADLCTHFAQGVTGERLFSNILGRLTCAGALNRAGLNPARYSVAT